MLFHKIIWSIRFLTIIPEFIKLRKRKSKNKIKKESMVYKISYHLVRFFPNNQEIKKGDQDKDILKNYTSLYLRRIYSIISKFDYPKLEGYISYALTMSNITNKISYI